MIVTLGGYGTCSIRGCLQSRSRCNFQMQDQDPHVKNMSPETRTVILKNGDQVPIIRRRANTPSRFAMPMPKINKHGIRNLNAVRMAEAITISAHSQQYARVQTQIAGLQIIEARSQLYERKGITAAHGVARVEAHKPFLIQVANFNGRPVALQRRERIAYDLRVPIKLNEDEPKSIPEVSLEGLSSPYRLSKT